MTLNKEEHTERVKRISHRKIMSNPNNKQLGDTGHNSIKNIVDRLQQSFIATKSSK